MRRVILPLLALLLVSCAGKSVSQAPQKASEKKTALIVLKTPGRPRNPLALDLDGDGQKELVVVAKSPKIYVFRKKDGNYKLSATYQVITHNTYLAALDLEADGDPDLVPITEALVGPVLLNDGRGNFTVSKLKYPAPRFGYALCATSLNSDLYPDLAAVGLFEEGLYLYLNERGQGFQQKKVKLPPAKDYFGGYKGMREVKPLPQKDGFDDLLLVHYFGKRVLLAENLGDGNFSFETLYEGPSTISSAALMGKRLVVAEEAIKRVLVLEKNAQGKFIPVKTIERDRAVPRRIISRGDTWAILWLKGLDSVIEIYHKAQLIDKIILTEKRCEYGLLEEDIIWCSDLRNNEVVGIKYAAE